MSTRRRALISGVSGQDGWYMARRLLAAGYEVFGTTHRSDGPGHPAPPEQLEIDGRPVPLRVMSLADAQRIAAVVGELRPDELYNFAARASSAQLFDDPLATADINGVAVARLLEAIRTESPSTRFCQASSSEVFAGATHSPQNEESLRTPTNAYGAAKAFADHLVAAYRATHGLFACSAVLYPHESPRRPAHFLVRKVARAAAHIAAGLQKDVTLGDLEAVRDWGYAPDYVEAMRLMLQAPEPRDYVVATGRAHRVQDVCEMAFRHVGLDWREHVRVDQGLKRSPERAARVGDAARARAELGWRPTLELSEMVGELVDLERAALASKNAS